MERRYRLGLDIGTASCALIALKLNPDGDAVGVDYHDLRIWQEPLDPGASGGVGLPKRARRRLARAARRVQQRRVRRLKKLRHMLPLLGLDPSTLPERHGDSILQLRAFAAREPIELADLALVLFKLVKRRGYAGGFRVVEDDQEGGVVKTGVSKLEEMLSSLRERDDRGETPTLGELIWHLRCTRKPGQSIKLKELGLYATREMVEEEFDRIWAVQARQHSALEGTANGQPLQHLFREAIFHQRPLRSPSPMVGRCQLESSLPRAPMAQMAAQRFRIEKQLADLRWGTGRRAERLSPQQRNVLRSYMEQHATLSFERAYKLLSEAGVPAPVGRLLNFDRSSREELKGNSTVFRMRRLGLGDDWEALDEVDQVRVINFLSDLGSPEQLAADDWASHIMTSGSKKTAKSRREAPRPRRFPAAMVSFIDALRRSGSLARLSAMGFDSGRSSYSVKALNRLADLMAREGCDEHEAKLRAYPPAKATRGANLQLGPPPVTGNVVVDVALRQIRHTVNLALRRMGGPPAEAILELSRDMALGVKTRAEIEKRIDTRRRERKRFAKAIEAHGRNPSAANILRYTLWNEQSQQHCPFCSRAIGMLEALDGNATHIEHIVPRSLTRVGKRQRDLVLAHRDCNDLKGDRTPYQAFGDDPGRWAAVERCAEALRRNRQFAKSRLLTNRESEVEVLDSKAINDFSDRQFHEASWIAKILAGWLREVCPDVMVSRGALTAHLRRIWGLDTVIAEERLGRGLDVLDTDGQSIDSGEFDHHRKFWEGHPDVDDLTRTDRRIDKRIDHRHHLIDAIVIACSDRSLYQRLAREYKERHERRLRGERVRLRMGARPPLPEIRRLATELVARSVPRHRPDPYLSGRMFEDTAYGLQRHPDENSDSPKLALRKRVADLAAKGDAPAKVRKRLLDIESPVVRSTVMDAFEARLAVGKQPHEALADPIEHPAYSTPERPVSIKRVRMLGDSSKSAAMISHRDRNGRIHRKWLEHDGYAYLQVNPFGFDGPVARPVPLRDALRQPSHERSGVRRFHKGDTVRDQKDGALFVVGQIKGEEGGRLMLVSVYETRRFDKLKVPARRAVAGRRLHDLERIDPDGGTSDTAD